MRISIFLAFAAALVALLTTQVAFATPCVPFPGSWTGDPETNSPLSNWVGSVYDHVSGCDSPVMGVTLNLASPSNESSVQIYIAERTDSNSSVSNPVLVYESEFSGDGNFHNVSFGGNEEVNGFTFKPDGAYLIMIKAQTTDNEEIGVDNTNGYSMWQLSQSSLPGPGDVWTTTASKKVRVWFHLMPSCNGILADQAGVCNGHGQCIGFDICDCAAGYDGTFCNSTQGGSSSGGENSSPNPQTSSNNGGGDNTTVIVISAIGAVVVVLIILVVVVVVIVAIVAGVIYYNQHRYPLPRTYSRPFAEMPGKDTDFSPMAI